jgi:hypothetical protein
MKLPIQSQPVMRGVSTSKLSAKMIIPSACDPNENCTRRGPNYPCPTLRNPGRMCESSFDDPVCLGRKAACQGTLIACVAGVIGTAAYAPSCAGCIYANIAVGGAALAACAVPCGVTAGALTLAVQNCA